MFSIGQTYGITPGTPHRIANSGEKDSRFLIVQGGRTYDWNAVDLLHTGAEIGRGNRQQIQVRDFRHGSGADISKCPAPLYLSKRTLIVGNEKSVRKWLDQAQGCPHWVNNGHRG